MKTSFVQIFDVKDDALKALGFIETAYPDHKHELVTSSNQVQVRSKIEGVSEAKAYGALDPAIVYLLLSVAPS